MTAASPGGPAVDGQPPRRQRSGRRNILLAVGGAFLVAILALAYLGFHYLPFKERAQTLKASVQQLSTELHGLGLSDVNAATLQRLHAQFADLDSQLQPFRDLLDSDPLLGIVAELPYIDRQVAGARVLSSPQPMTSWRRAPRDCSWATSSWPSGSMSPAPPATPCCPAWSSSMATSTTDVDQVQSDLDAAAAQLVTIPDLSLGQIRDIRDLITASLDKYSPLLDEYRSIDGVVPAVLGWGGEKRYLVLAQDPAELRPTGGYTGTVGTVTFKDGRLTDHSFQDVYALDLKPGLPYVTPPDALKNHLLGDYSWQLADANWSPDFPTSAQQALHLYELESGDTNIDGVIALTTYALDRILSLTGPVDVPGYGVTVKAGDVTMAALGATRTSADPNVNRKAFLNELANRVLDRLLALPATRWADLVDTLKGIDDERLMLAWFKDPGAQGLIAGTALTGVVRQDPGDYLMVVDSNVAPTSKYNLVVTRSTDLAVAIDAAGTTASSLKLAWQNDAGKDGEPYASLRKYSTNQDGIYGVYTRILTPAGSQVGDVQGQSMVPVSGPESSDAEAGRQTYGNFLLVPAGTATLDYQWQTPSLVETVDGQHLYRLTIQKQPGMGPEPLTVQIIVPDGATIVDESQGMVVSGGTATYNGTLTDDLQLSVRYK